MLRKSRRSNRKGKEQNIANSFSVLIVGRIVFQDDEVVYEQGDYCGHFNGSFSSGICR